MTRASKTVIVTGANSGLGRETARAILREGVGWHVVIAGRSSSRCQEAARRLSRDTGNTFVEALPLDLASLAAVRQFAADFRPAIGHRSEPWSVMPGFSTWARPSAPTTASKPPSRSTIWPIFCWRT